MKAYGSLSNRVEENHIYDADEIKEGMGATIYYWSDTHAYEVIKVFNQNHIIIRRMKAKKIKGSCQDGSAEYSYESAPQNSPVELKLFKRGWFVVNLNEKGHLVKATSLRTNISFNVMQEYFDPTF